MRIGSGWLCDRTEASARGGVEDGVVHGLLCVSRLAHLDRHLASMQEGPSRIHVRVAALLSPRARFHYGRKTRSPAAFARASWRSS